MTVNILYLCRETGRCCEIIDFSDEESIFDSVSHVAMLNLPAVMCSAVSSCGGFVLS